MARGRTYTTAASSNFSVVGRWQPARDARPRYAESTTSRRACCCAGARSTTPAEKRRPSPRSSSHRPRRWRSGVRRTREVLRQARPGEQDPKKRGWRHSECWRFLRERQDGKLFPNLKIEEVYPKNYRTFEEAEANIGEYIEEVYNKKR